MSPKSRGRKKSKSPQRSPQNKLTKPQLNDLEVNSVHHVKANVQYRSAPIPTPEDLNGYGVVDPSFPDRIMRMAEKQQRASNLNKFFENLSFAAHSLLGQIFTFASFLVLAYLIFNATNLGNDAAVGWISSCGAGILGVFIFQRRKRR